MGLTTEKTGDLVSIWGQANVQNELDTVAHVVSSAQEVPFPLEALLVFPRNLLSQGMYRLFRGNDEKKPINSCLICIASNF